MMTVKVMIKVTMTIMMSESDSDGDGNIDNHRHIINADILLINSLIFSKTNYIKTITAK